MGAAGVRSFDERIHLWVMIRLILGISETAFLSDFKTKYARVQNTGRASTRLQQTVWTVGRIPNVL